MGRFKCAIAGMVLMLFTAGTASAATYQIQFTGINLNYNQATGDLCDSGGGTGCFAAADPLITMTFLLDGALQGILLADIGLNVFMSLPDGTSPFVDATTNVVGSAFDVFDLQINGGPGLFTDMTSGAITFDNNSLNASGQGFSTVFAQNLPFGFSATDPVNWSFSTGLGVCTGPGGQAACTYAGTGEMSWTTVPDGGSTLALLGLGLVSLRSLRRRFAGR